MTEQNDTQEAGAPEVAMVVGLGASAGGIQALSTFFTNVGAPSEPIVYVVILHPSPDCDSRLAQVLQTVTPMPVRQVTSPVTLQSGHVYVVSPNHTLSLAGRTLTPVSTMQPEERRAPVDMFFRTLAAVFGPRAAAVVLSGTGANGSNGLKQVKEQGGLTIAQDPTDAEFGDMPYNSIATGLVDFVLPAADIPKKIVEYAGRLRRSPVLRAPESAPRPPAAGDGGIETDALAAEDWRDILTLVRLRTGHDFANYKPATLRRRVERRMHIRGLATLSAYAGLLRDHPDEPTALMKDLLISVTNFFRDREAWAALEQRVIPHLFTRKGAADQIRVWSAGCATGEEAYSLAMLLAERADGALDSPALQVFATDVDSDAIARARDGLYTEADVADIAPERLQRFFHHEPGGFRVRREVREMVLFAHHNLIRDPPFPHLDLIACRNVLIYLTRPTQERVLEAFHFALDARGYLFLGQAETADVDGDRFAALDRAQHLFESRTVIARPTRARADRGVPNLPAVPAVPRVPEPRLSSERLAPGDLHLRLLEQFAPPSLVVTEENVLLHVSAHATRYLQMTAGEPSRDVLELARPELRGDLRTALHLALQQRSTIEVGGVRVAAGGRQGLVRITVRPVLRADDPPRGYLLVLFAEEEGPVPGPVANGRTNTSLDAGTRGLEEELVRLKGQLGATIEQYETHAEEARAESEELQAMNEELRSAAEELETSKEELQSVNEELTTVNQAWRIKVEELGLRNNDFQNLINSTDIAAIFLDRQLRVKMSTPAATRIFNLLPIDIGRRLSDITSALIDDRLHDDALQVLDRPQTIERDVETTDGRHLLMRVLPYRTTDNRIDGVSITFHDITAWRVAESRGRASEERLRLLIDSAIDYAVFTLTEEGRVDSWNRGAERMFGYRAEEIIGSDAAVLFMPEDRLSGVPGMEIDTARRDGRAMDERWHLRRDGTRFYCSGVMTRLGDGLGFAKIARDLTHQRQAEIDLQQARADLENRVVQRTADMQAEVVRRARAQENVMDLLRKLVTAQEDERARIARDLHDQFGQQLTALRLALEHHRDGHGAGYADENLDRALTLTRQIDRQIDFLAWELRPATLDDLGLTVALPRYVKEWSAQYGLEADYQTTGLVQARLTPDAETVFYRVAQEALTNVVKHAHASRVGVVLEGRADAIVLIVEDDGVGFEPGGGDGTPTGIGLVGMFERASLIGATLQVESQPGEGTTVFLRCPVSQAAQAAT